MRVSKSSSGPFGEGGPTGTARGLASPLPGNGNAAGKAHALHQQPAEMNVSQPAANSNSFLELESRSGTGALAWRLCNDMKMGLSLGPPLLLVGPMPGYRSSCKHSQTDQGTKCQTSLDYSHEPNKQDLAGIQDSVSYPLLKSSG